MAYRTLLDEMLMWPHAEDFARPVSEIWSADDLPGYSNVVRRPMDIGTVRRSMEQGVYVTPSGTFHASACAADVSLTFANAMAYNAEGTPFHAEAKALATRFSERVAALDASLAAIPPTPPRSFGEQPARATAAGASSSSSKIPPRRVASATVSLPLPPPGAHGVAAGASARRPGDLSTQPPAKAGALQRGRPPAAPSHAQRLPQTTSTGGTPLRGAAAAAVAAAARRRAAAAAAAAAGGAVASPAAAARPPRPLGSAKKGKAPAVSTGFPRTALKDASASQQGGAAGPAGAAAGSEASRANVVMLPRDQDGKFLKSGAPSPRGGAAGGSSSAKPPLGVRPRQGAPPSSASSAEGRPRAEDGPWLKSPDYIFCHRLLREMHRWRDAGSFTRPVYELWPARDIPDYSAVVDKLMDLGTALEYADTGVYTSASGVFNAQAVADDVRLTFQNSLRYNPVGSSYHNEAKTLLARFESRWVDLPSAQAARAREENNDSALARPSRGGGSSSRGGDTKAGAGGLVGAAAAAAAAAASSAAVRSHRSGGSGRKAPRGAASSAGSGSSLHPASASKGGGGAYGAAGATSDTSKRSGAAVPGVAKPIAKRVRRRKRVGVVDANGQLPGVPPAGMAAAAAAMTAAVAGRTASSARPPVAAPPAPPLLAAAAPVPVAPVAVAPVAPTAVVPAAAAPSPPLPGMAVSTIAPFACRSLGRRRGGGRKPPVVKGLEDRLRDMVKQRNGLAFDVSWAYRERAKRRRTAALTGVMPLPVDTRRLCAEVNRLQPDRQRDVLKVIADATRRTELAAAWTSKTAAVVDVAALPPVVLRAVQAYLDALLRNGADYEFVTDYAALLAMDVEIRRVEEELVARYNS